MKTLDELMAELTQLNVKLTEATTQVTSLTADRDTARVSLTAITGERDKLKTDLTAVTTERDTLKAANADLVAKQSNFDTKLAAELAKHGVTTGSAKTESGNDAKPKTATEQLLMSKGVKTLAELAQLKK